MPKTRYVVKRIINKPDDDVSWDIYLEDSSGWEYVGEFVKRNDAILFAKLKNKLYKGDFKNAQNKH